MTTTDISAPHCDELIVHKPRSCEYCDRYPARQQARVFNKIAFTNDDQDFAESIGFARCPSTERRSAEVRDRWPGNQPKGSDEEVRIVSETGGEKGTKPAQLGAIDPLALLALAEVAGYGAEKYSAFNYLKGYDWSLSFNAAQRHALAFWMGEDFDPESGLPHAAHLAWHGLCLTSFLLRDLGHDDRYIQFEDDEEPQEEPDEPLFDFVSLIAGLGELLAGMDIEKDCGS